MSTFPVLARARAKLQRALGRSFPGSAAYWETRYLAGGSSGAGSRNELASFKANFLNDFVKANYIGSVIEFGCGDGAQLALFDFPSYFGVDVAKWSVDHCSALYAADSTRRFSTKAPDGKLFDLAISLDVIYHLVEDQVFEEHMFDLFRHARKWVIIYSSNMTESDFVARYPGYFAPHVRHRCFSDWVLRNAPDWELSRFSANAYPFDPLQPDTTSFSEFYVYTRCVGEES